MLNLGGKKGVREKSENKQTPWVVSNLEGEFYFTEPVTVPAPPSAIAVDPKMVEFRYRDSVHIKKIYTKLNLNSRSHAIYQVLQRNLIKPLTVVSR